MNTELSRDGRTVTITVSGRFTTDETARFLKTIEPLKEETGLDVLAELSGLDFISSAGLRCFVMLLKTCSSAGSTLTLKHLTPQIRDIFTLTSLLDKFNVE